MGSLEPEDAERMASMYGRYVKLPDRLLVLLKQVENDTAPDASCDEAIALVMASVWLVEPLLGSW